MYLGFLYRAIFIVLVPEVLTNVLSIIARLTQNPDVTVLIAPMRLIIHGFMIVLFIVIEPGGLAGIWHKVSSYWKIWPLPYI